MTDAKPTTDEILSRALKPCPMTPAKMQAFFSAAEIAMKAVMQAGADGNVRCQIAVEEMEPFLRTMKQK